MYPRIEAFLQQSMSERADYAASTSHLSSLFDPT